MILTERHIIEKRVRSSSDVDLVMVIRNASLDGMTKNAYATSEIEQYRYWLDNYDRLQAWLYFLNNDWLETDPVGYASLRRDDDGKLWSFMAVSPEYRGRGIGKVIQRHHVRQTDEDVYDEILETNVACLEMTRKSGDWRVIDRRDGRVYQISERSARG